VTLRPLIDVGCSFPIVRAIFVPGHEFSSFSFLRRIYVDRVIIPRMPRTQLMRNGVEFVKICFPDESSRRTDDKSDLTETVRLTNTDIGQEVYHLIDVDSARIKLLQSHALCIITRNNRISGMLEI
jgi:hypothetical protein